MNESTGKTLGCLLWLVVILAFWGGCKYSDYSKAKQIEEQKLKDSIRKAFVKDSLEHDPQYQDSVRKSKIAFNKWLAERDSIDSIEVKGFMFDGDSIYHTCIHDVYYMNMHSFGYTINDIKKLRFITKTEAEKYWHCRECGSIEDAYRRFQDGELFSEEDAMDHDLIPIDQANEYIYPDDEKEW